MRRLSVLVSLSAALALSACVAPAEPEPVAAAPLPIPAPRPLPTPAPAPQSADWRDWPITPGNWTYRAAPAGGAASFGVAGQEPELTLRCDRTQGRVTLARRGQSGGALALRTTSTTRQLNLRADATAELAPSDSILDAMGYSRGRFVVEGPGRLVVPAWAEILRVTEDCRG